MRAWLLNKNICLYYKMRRFVITKRYALVTYQALEKVILLSGRPKFKQKGGKNDD